MFRFEFERLLQSLNSGLRDFRNISANYRKFPQKLKPMTRLLSDN